MSSQRRRAGGARPSGGASQPRAAAAAFIELADVGLLILSVAAAVVVERETEHLFELAARVRRASHGC
jgi:hypothetical protein